MRCWSTETLDGAQVEEIVKTGKFTPPPGFHQDRSAEWCSGGHPLPEVIKPVPPKLPGFGSPAPPRPEFAGSKPTLPPTTRVRQGRPRFRNGRTHDLDRATGLINFEPGDGIAANPKCTAAVPGNGIHRQ